MSPPQNITVSKVARAQPKDRVYRIADRGRRGFLLTVYPSSRKCFQYRYKVKGVQRIIALGDIPGTDLADAHLEYDRLRKLVRKGIDPKAPVITETGATFGDVAEGWYQQVCLGKVKDKSGQWVRHPNRTPRKRPEYPRGVLDNHLLPNWKDRDIQTITRLDANRRLDEIIAAGSPIMANRVGAMISQIWSWAIDEGILEATPMQKLSKRGGREQSRERTLNDDELKQFWNRLDDSKLSNVTIATLRFALLTGARRAEVAGARWREIQNDVWTIPATRTKSGKAHKVPLSDAAKDVLEGVRGLDTVAVFPSTAGGSLRPDALTRAVHRKLKHFGIAQFTPHDLRRTVRSKLAELGVSPVVAKKCLGHALEGMDAVYDRHEYLEEKRDALQKWADHLQAVVEGKKQKVVSIASAQ